MIDHTRVAPIFSPRHNGTLPNSHMVFFSVLKRWCVLQSVDSIPLIYLSDAIFEQVYIAGDSPKSEIYRDNNLRYILLLLLMMVPT